MNKSASPPRQAQTFVAWLSLASTLLLQAQNADPFGIKPKSHDRNKALASSRYASSLKAHEGQPDVLVLPGLIADRARRRVEVWVERSAVAPSEPCEFLLVGELSDHTYETLLISFARPTDVHRALEFLGAKPGEPFDPGSLRYWPKGESFVIRLFRKDQPPMPVESLLLDRRTGQALPEGRFMFTGSGRVAAREGASAVYSADVVQPMSIVSLFNAANPVLQVPHRAPKDVVYQNTVIHPEAMPENEGLLTLLIEPANRPGETRVKELELEVVATGEAAGTPSSDADRLKALRVQLNEPGAVLQERSSLPALLERLALLDRRRHDFFLTVRFGDDLALGHARAMAGVLALIDSDRGVRIEPPPTQHLYYRAFTPDRNLLDRSARIFHPAELVVSEREAKVSGKLVFVTPVQKQEGSRSELEITEVPVPGPAELRRELDAENRRMRERDQGSRPPVLMVFASSTMGYGKLMKFLAPILPTHRTIHLYLDEPSASLPANQPSP
ncbi:MAG: hypothetical protein HY735_14930 [Verrucomicrobia bacterium]|nr:hypothetical protein [Verrucomicrobiota bacterium]